MTNNKHGKYGTSEAIREKHKAIRDRYEQLQAKEKELDSVRFRYIAKAYYVELISQDPIIGLSRNYIHRILNERG